MKRIVLDGAEISAAGQLHDALQRELELPAWYGRNLDALHDCLTILKEVELVLRHWPGEGYLHRARRVMEDAAGENPALHIIVE